MHLDIQHNIDQVLRRVDERKKSIPVAASNAANTTVFKVRELEIEEMKRVLDRPTRYTLGAFFVRRATAAQLSAEVFLKESYAGKHYLRPQIFGGGRPMKGFEHALRARGFLPPGMFAVPGEGAKIDAHGNISRGQIMKVLSALKLAERFAGYSANRTQASAKRKRRKLEEYFVGTPGGKAPLGVWQRVRFAMGSAVKPILIFVKQPMYQPRFDFYRVARTAAGKAFPLHFERELRGIPTGRSLGLSR